MKLEVDVELEGLKTVKEKRDAVMDCVMALDTAISDLKRAVVDLRAKISQPMAETID